LQQQIDILKRVSKTLHKNSRGVDIKLKSESGMFHPKLFLFEGDN